MVGTPVLNPLLLLLLLLPEAPASLGELSPSQIVWTGSLSQVGLGFVGWGGNAERWKRVGASVILGWNYLLLTWILRAEL